MLSLERQNALREQYRQMHPGWRPATEVYAHLARGQLSLYSRVLDLGCGRGGLVEQLEHPHQQVIGIDPDLLSLREHRLPVPRVQGFSHPLPFARDSFDLVFASWLLEHLQEPANDFAEIARVLRPGGSFAFITPNRRHPLALFNRLLGQLGQLQGWLVNRLYARAPADTFPTAYRANSEDDLRRLGSASGLDLVTLHCISDPTYLAFTPTLFRAMARLEERLPPERALHLVGAMRKASKAA